MKLFGLKIERQKPQRRGGTTARSFRAGDQNDLTNAWKRDFGYTPAETSDKLALIRSRARDLAKNNPYAKKSLWMLAVNVVGSKGFILRSQAGSFANNEFQPDVAANSELEREWKRWAQSPPWCDMSTRSSLVDFQRLAITHMVRDGEAIIRIYRGTRRNSNPYGLSLRMLPPESLDERLNQQLKNGNEIRNGIEFDNFDAPVAYYFRKRTKSLHSSDPYPAYNQTEHVRVVAKDIIHLFIDEACNQERGWPWLYSVMNRLHHLEEYDQAELVAAREAASRTRMWSRTSTDAIDEDNVASPEDVAGSATEIEPGSQDVAPLGWTATDYVPNRPNTAFPDYHKASLRSVASGAYVDYNALGSDAEGVSWSTLREFKLHFTDFCRVLQEQMINHLMTRVYREWLIMYLSFGDTRLPFSKMSKFMNHTFKGRRWQWVNPQQEAKANEMARDYGWKTDEGIADELGEDYDENVSTIRRQKKTVKGTYLENLDKEADNAGNQ